MKIKQITFLGLSFLLFSCGQQTKKNDKIATVKRTDSGAIQTKPNTLKSETFHEEVINSPYQEQLDLVLNDSTVDQYFKDTYIQEKLIIANDNKMLTITDSLSSRNLEKALFYFIVFTKSMNGSDGFYSEAVGLAAFNFVNNRTEQFADYFNLAPKLTNKDMNNWAKHIYGEIQITRENHELEAVRELETRLFDNIKGKRKEYKLVIEKLIEKIKSTAHNNGQNA